MFVREISPKTRLVILGLTWTLAGVLSLQAQKPLPNSKPEPITGSISGRVSNESGQGIPNAMVYARASVTFAPRITATDSEGNFKFEGLDSALYLLGTAAPGYVMPAPDPEAEPVY
jgi:carboxypeptidase family protein